MDNDVPLIVPEVNLDQLQNYKKKNIIANANCSTIQMVVALKPLHDHFNIKRVIVSTYQSVSGAGKAPMDELITQSKDFLEGKWNKLYNKSNIPGRPESIGFQTSKLSNRFNSKTSDRLTYVDSFSIFN